jgi:hypothetical protein
VVIAFFLEISASGCRFVVFGNLSGCQGGCPPQCRLS